MLAILNSLNARNLPIFQPILIILVSKFMVHRALSDKTYLYLGVVSPLSVSGCLKGNIVVILTLKFKGSDLANFISDLLSIVFGKYTGIN